MPAGGHLSRLHSIIPDISWSVRARPGKAIAILAAALCLCGRAAPAQVILSEIHYHPVEEPSFYADGTPVLQLTNDVHEFVELQNTGSSAVDLTGWRLAGGISYTFPSNTTLAAGAFCVIAKDPARLATVYSLATSSVLGAYSGHLKNGSDTVRLRDSAGSTVDSVTYDSMFPWAGSADAFGAQDRFTGLTSSNYQYKGRSLQRVSTTWPSSDPANWLASPLSGPTPGAAQAVTRTVPKPVVVAQSAVQTGDGAVIVRSNNAVTVHCTYSSVTNLASVSLEYFIDDINSYLEARTTVAMTDLGGGKYSASIPGQADRAVVRYRFKANRGDGLEVVSPRADDPQVSAIGTNGAREAWHGYFVTPVRTSTNAIYDVFVSTASLLVLNTNVIQNPRRVTASTALGVPRDTPYVAATAPLWDGTRPAVFACNGGLWDIEIRYHGSRYHRAAANNSFKLHFPVHHPFNEQSSWFVTGHGTEFIEAQKLNRMLRLPASKMRLVSWYYNGNAVITRSEQGEYGGEMLEDYHELMQQLNPGSEKEEIGDLYKDVGNRDASQNNVEGPYTRGDLAPMLANAGWTQLQRYDWTLNIQNHSWKGPKPVRDMTEGLWTARGDSPSTHNFQTNATLLANTRAWFTNHWDIETTITSMALLEWMSIWDDACQNCFYWRRADGRWSRLGWDYDGVMQIASFTAGGTGGATNQPIYGGEYGAATVFDGVNWWKDTFYKCYRTEYNQRLWELANSFCDPTNLTALGFSQAAAFAVGRRAYVNAQLSALGAYYKPARPTNAAPVNGAAVFSATNLVTSAYAHPQSTPHAATKWEIRASDGDYEEPVVCLTSTNDRTSLAVPFDQLAYGRTYWWRATHIDTNGHPSIVSAETRFSWGPSSTNAGTLVLNEVLAINRGAAQNASTIGDYFPDYIELRNNGATAIALTGYALTDNPLAPSKYVFPAGTTIGAGEHLVVWCDSDTNTAGLHSGFKLDGDGDQLLLLGSTSIVDSVTYGPQAPDVSIGRIVNGTGGWQANTPTPGAANSAKTLGDVSALRINEWMAAPAYGEDWFEIHNTSSNVVALSGLWLSDTPSDPKVTQIPALSFIEPGGFTKFFADGSPDGGNHGNFKLNENGESLVLTAANGATTIDTLTFGAQAPDTAQGRLPDGGGTIVSFASQTASPGAMNWAPAPVFINEVIANTASPFEDAIEIRNPTAAAVDIGGWWLSDFRMQRKKFQIPAGTSVPANGYVVFYKAALEAGAVPFSFSAFDDEAVLSAVDGTGALTGYGSLVHFPPSAENVSFGRVPATGLDASSGAAEFWPQAAHTFGQDNPPDVATFRTGTGATNAAPRIGPVTINEIMYHPVDPTNGTDNTDDEFIELFNPGTNAVSLAGWRLTGDTEYEFPAPATLAAGAYLLLVSFAPTDTVTLAAFRTNYNLSAGVTVYGPYSEKLANSTFKLEIDRPATNGGYSTHITVDRVEYRDIAPWPTAPDGGGESLQRTSSTIIGNTAENWLGDAPTPGAVNAGVLVGLSITTVSPLPGGVAGVPYTNALAASGGTAPYAWAMATGAVPGLALSAAGVLAGTPSAAGVHAFIAAVTDGVAAVATKPLSVTIAATALSVTTASPLPDGTVAVAYTQTLAAAGGTAPYAWSVSAGSLPAGLALNGAGVLAGTPTAAGSYGFTIRAADSGGLEATKAFTLFIPVPPLTISTASPLPAAEWNAPYSRAMTAVGGVTPYEWSLAGGALPAGLTLDTDGTLGGTPSARGDFSFAMRLADHAGAAVTGQFTLAVVPAPLRILTASLPDGVAGDVYAQTLTATGGVPPYAWTLHTGFPPDGLEIGGAGSLSGTPTNAGVFLFSVQAADAVGVATTAPFSVTIAASGPLDHFTWDYEPDAAIAGEPFAVRVTARDAVERVVQSLNSGVPVGAASGSGTLHSPIVITEITDGGEDQFELQNVTTNEVITSTWSVFLGDSLTDINTMNANVFFLPASMPAGGILRVSELNTNLAGRTWFGGPIGWSSSATTNTKGWIMLFDAQSVLRDMAVIGWTSAQLALLSVDVNGEAVTPAGQWSGDGFLPGARGAGGTTQDSWQRIGTNDQNSAVDWVWRHNTNATDATSFGATNAGLTVPWSTTIPIPMTPTNLTMTLGEYLGWASVLQAATSVRMTANDGAGHTGVTSAFDVLAGADSDSDGMPDVWENAHSLAVGVNDAALDPDGDGMPNIEEYLANTDPRVFASRLVITGAASMAAGRVTVAWSGVAGRLYRISCCNDLVTWVPLDSRILVTASGTQTATLDGAGATLFLRVEAETPP